jgi:hypothetical protein
MKLKYEMNAAKTLLETLLRPLLLCYRVRVSFMSADIAQSRDEAIRLLVG